jgi:hypothetical protein
MARDFVEKKQMIVDKLRELRTQKRSIEEIYKYTTDIILEEEDEEDEDDEKSEEKEEVKVRGKTSKTQVIKQPIMPKGNIKISIDG